MNHYFVILLPLLLIVSYVGVGQNAKLNGRVIDAESHAPVPFANVVIKGTTNGQVTTEAGTFSFENLSSGFIFVEVSFVGYQTTISSEIEVSNARVKFIEIEIKPSTQSIDEIQIKASPYRTTAESPLSLRSISVAEIETAPGANRDLSRVIQSFPGISAPVSHRNDIIVRGGGPSENSFFIDEVEIPTINHFATQGASGGPVGIINADLISEIEYYSGAFPVNRGDALSGVFEFKQKDGNPYKMRFSTSVGASEVTATADGPLGAKTTLLFSARRSYLQLLFSLLELPFLPTFNDVQFKLKTKFDNENELTLIGLGAYDDLELNTDIEDPDEQQQAALASIPENHQRSYTIGAVYKRYHQNGHHTFVLSRSYMFNEALKYIDNDESSEQNLMFDYESMEAANKFRYENQLRLEEWNLNYGIGVNIDSYMANNRGARFYDGQVIPIIYETDLNLFSGYLFVQAHRRFINNRLLISTAIRTEANDYNHQMNNFLKQLSPRISASYRVGNNWTINANTGRYYQLPQFTTLGFKRNDRLVNKQNGIRYVTSTHVVAGVRYEPSARLQFTTELFAKKYSRYPFSVNQQVSLANLGADYGVVGDEEVTSTSEGRAYGFEMLLRLNTMKKFHLNAAYTFVRSEFTNLNSQYIASAWDSKHLLVATATKDLKRNWKVGTKLRLSGGLPYTPYDVEKSSLIEAWDLQGEPYLKLDSRNSLRFGSFAQVDLRIDKYYYLSNLTLKFYLDIQNLTNSKSPEQDLLVRQTDDQGNFLITENGQQYLLKRVKQEGGNILPTIGIILQF